jgi:TonB family protein
MSNLNFNRLEGIKTAYLNNNSNSFSFFNSMVIGTKNISSKETTMIFEHEKIHIKHKHSYDILLLEIIKILQWYNPFVYILKRFVSINHEYTADYFVNKKYKQSEYLELITKNINGALLYNVNLFIKHSQIIRRLEMLTNTKTYTTGKYKYAGIIASSAIIISVFTTSNLNSSTKDIALQPNNTQQTEKILLNIDFDTENIILANATHSENETAIETMDLAVASSLKKMDKTERSAAKIKKMVLEQDFIKEIRKHIAKNLEYPKQAIKNGITGVVLLEIQINNKGEIKKVKKKSTTITANNKKSGKNNSDYGLTSAAIKVMESAPKLTPPKDSNGKTVATTIALPVNFKLK